VLGTGIALAFYFTAFLMLTETASTMVNVNYHSLLPELYRDRGERNRANSLRQALQLVGMILGVSLAPLLADMVGFQITAIIMAITGGALVIYSVLGYKERKEFSDMPQPQLLKSMRDLAKNKNFWCVAFTNFFYQGTSGLLLAGIPFFVRFALGQPDGMIAVLTGAVFVTAIPAIYGWFRVIRWLGPLKAWRIALAWLGISIVPMLFAGDILFAGFVGALIGIGIAGVTASMDLVYSELIEEDAARNGLRREATFFASISFIIRLNGLVRSGVFFLLFYFWAFESGDNPGPMPEVATRYMITIFPIILMLGAVIMSHFVKFKITTESNTEQIAEPSTEPSTEQATE
jgi:GPH family glycoside/pentoside/hexuronide:cation symporter